MSERARVMALAGVFQAASLVQQQAHTGRVAANPFEASIASVLKLDVSAVDEIFGGVDGVLHGLEVLRAQLANAGPGRDPELASYVLGLLHLERMLSRRQPMLGALRAGLERAAAQTRLYAPTHPNVMANLAGIYGDTLSTLRFRIMVRGEPAYLDSGGGADRVRALLLAGIRAAVLWRGLGGSRLGLLLRRSHTRRVAQRLLADA